MKLTLATIMTLSLATAQMATAQPADVRQDHRELRQDQRELHQDRRDLHGDQKDWRDDHRGPHFNEHLGHGRYIQGERLPPNYRTYEVRDWQARRLRPPPAGYYWTRVDNDYVLAAAATGVIASIIAASQY